MKLTPYIHFPGNAEEALHFYKQVFGAEVDALNRYGDTPMPTDDDYKQKIIHARLVFGGNVLMLSDTFKGNSVHTNGNIQLSIDVPDKLQLEDIFTQLAAGGTITMPLQNQFWGATFGMLQDKFGVNWMLSHDTTAHGKAAE